MVAAWLNHLSTFRHIPSSTASVMSTTISRRPYFSKCWNLLAIRKYNLLSKTSRLVGICFCPETSQECLLEHKTISSSHHARCYSTSWIHRHKPPKPEDEHIIADAYSSTNGEDDSGERIKVTINIDQIRAAIVQKLGIGSHKWTQLLSPSLQHDGKNDVGDDENMYHRIMETALLNGITTLEVGQDMGGDAAMVDVLANTNSTNPSVSLLKRVGYRTVVPPRSTASSSSKEEDNENDKNKEDNQNVKHDDEEEEEEEDKEESDLEKSARSLFPSLAKLLPGDVKVEDLQHREGSVVHNISKVAIQAALDESPLCYPYLKAGKDGQTKIQLSILLHNPEVQAWADASLTTAQLRQARICDKLTESFLALEDEITSDGRIASYGIVSNGLGLPPDHPLHLSWSQAIVPALNQARLQLGRQEPPTALNFKIVQLPVNLLETTGLTVARKIKEDEDYKHVQVYAMRPLTAYPELGTGSGHPFVFADYALPATMEKKYTWTNQMSAPPQVYEIALKNTMQYFDAEDILKDQIQGKELTPEQRETLDGCKLMQSLLHDVDNSLEQLRSWDAHQDYLLNSVIPLIHDTFEAYDDNTADALRNFFSTYSMAAKYYIAKNIRRLLKQGDVDGKSGSNSNSNKVPPTFPDLADDVLLQDYALSFVLKSDHIDRVIVGCTEQDHVVHDMEVVHLWMMEKNEQKEQQQQ